MTTGPTHGHVSDPTARLAAQGFATKTRFARTQANFMHPELVTLRMKMLDREAAQINARDREIEEAERRGRAGRWCP